MQKVIPSIRAALWAAVSLAAVVGMVASPAVARAATNNSSQQSITLSPASTTPSVAPGGTYQGNLQVLNNGGSNFSITVYAQPYRVKGVDYTPEFTQLPGTTDASKWVHLITANFIIPPHGKVTIPYTLTVPTATAPGGYYAVIFVQTAPHIGSNGVQTSNRVGDILYITAQGKVRTGGSVISTPLPHFTTASSLPLSVEVSNTGGVHFQTNATVTVTNIYGKTVFSGNLQRYVLPQTIRKISTDWKTPIVGVYKVARSATVAGHTKSLPTQWVVVIRPWAIIAVVVLILLIIASIWYPGRLKKRKAEK